MLSVYDLPGLHSIGHVMTLVFMALGMVAAIHGFFDDRRRERAQEAEKEEASASIPPPAPAFAASKTEASSRTVASRSASPEKASPSLSSAPVNAGPASEGNQPRQADLAEALLEHLEAQGYEFDPGPSPGR